MKLINLKIEGIGPHENTEIDFSSLNTLTGLVASYGTGKTFLVESVMATLFGSFVWYESSVYDALSQGGTGKGSMKLVFEHNDAIYLATREISDTGKTRTQKATLYRYDNGNEEAIAGPKVSDFDAYVSAHIGDFATAKATWFLSQNRGGDLCGQPGEEKLEARRRMVFNSLIGAGDIDAIEKRCAEKHRDLVNVAEELEAQLAGEEDPEERREELTQALKEAQDELTDANKQLKEKEAKLETVLCAIRDAEGGDDILKGQIEDFDAKHAAAHAIKNRAQELMFEKQRLSGLASGLDQAMSDLDERGELLSSRATCDADIEAFNRWQDWKRHKAELEGAIASLNSEIESLQLSTVSDEDRELAGRIEELRQAYYDAKEANEKAEAHNKDVAQYREAINAAKSRLVSNIEDIEKRLAGKPETPFGDKCAPCQFLAEFQALPGKLEELKAELSKQEANLAELPADMPIINMEPIIARGQRAKGAVEAVEKAKQAEAKLEATRKALSAERDELEAHRENEPERAEDKSGTLKRINARLDELSGAAERVKQCEQAAAQVESKQAQIDACEKELIESVKKMEAAREKAESAKKVLAGREVQRSELRQQETAERSGLEAAKESVAAIEAKISRLYAWLEVCDGKAEEIEGKRSRVAKMRHTIGYLADLRKCFGARGVKQLLIDAAAPALSDIADKLFDIATGGRMRLRIATQAVNQDGSSREAFQILVTDERGERDALRFSGGQLQLIQIIFRIAVALWTGQIHGSRPDVLILDEAFDRLGADGTEDLLRVLEYLAEDLSQIIVITHDPMIADRMQSQIRLSKSAAGVTVALNGVREGVAA